MLAPIFGIIFFVFCFLNSCFKFSFYFLFYLNGQSITKHYKSLRRALMDIYPEVSFDLSKWKKVSSMNFFYYKNL
jgi:hypothetical protein